jgi:MFS family permease
MVDAVDVSAIAMDARPFGWLRGAPLPARRALAAAWIAWMFDSFDVMLFSMLLTSVLAEFGLSKAAGGVLGSLTFIAAAVGGLLFGKLADARGRRISLVISILFYAVFTAACGVAQTVWQLAIFRVALGLGMGGGWTCGAALVSETWPDRHRGKAIGVMQSAWAVGYGLAALAAAVVQPRFGWRATFLLGIVPVVCAIWIHRRIEEPDIWTASHRDEPRRAGSLGPIFRQPFRRTTIAMILLSTCSLYAYWAFNFWVPAYLALPGAQRGAGFSTGTVALLLVTMQIGGWLGYVTYGYVSDAFGRRRSFVTYLLASAALVALYGALRNPALLLILGPFVAFFSTGYFSGFGAIAAELYPTYLRATATGFTFNVGRLGSAIAPLMIGSFAQTYGFGLAFATTSAALVCAAISWIWIPETRGRRLLS